MVAGVSSAEMIKAGLLMVTAAASTTAHAGVFHASDWALLVPEPQRSVLR